MIAVKLMGGLGNQMFQYALGRKLALKHGTSLMLDTSALGVEIPNTTFREYELKHFSIDASTGTSQDIFMELFQEVGGVKFNLAKTKRKLGFSLKAPNLIKERGFAFQPQALSARNNSYLQGYWQSEKYFKDIRPQLLNDFSPREPVGKINQDLIDEFRNLDVVSVHVRRGDYVTAPKIAEAHGHCTLEYYRRAFQAIEDSIETPCYCFFSDDIEWVKQNIKVKGQGFYVDHNHDMGYKDLFLMAHCKHHIIANSSFSWCGAWLGRNPDKIVVRPERWFNVSHLDTSDLCPAEWLLVPNS